MSTYRLTYRPDDVSVPGTVAFGIAEPADEHEAAVLLRWPAAAWIAQGTPRELLVALSAPITEASA